MSKSLRPFTFCVLLLLFFCQIQGQAVIGELKRVGAKKTGSLDSNGWKHTGLFTINVNQGSLSYWSSGGESFLIGINGILNKSMHHRHGKYTWDSYFDLELGYVDASSFKKFRKTNDRCDLTSEFEHRLSKHISYGLIGNLNTQVFSGHNYFTSSHEKISNFLSPGKILVSMGLDFKKHSEESFFDVFITPATIRWVTKIDPDFRLLNKFGVDSAHKVNTELGAYLSTHYNTRFSKTLSYIGRLDLFCNYKRNPQNVDVLFNNLLTFAIARNFAGSVLIDVIYDDDIRRRTQIQELMGLGIKFNL